MPPTGGNGSSAAPDRSTGDAVDAVDVLVVGGGMAGMAAGVSAAAEDAAVLVLERAGRPGGAALRSMGSLWTFTDPKAYARSCPGADPEVSGILQRGFHEAVEWLRQLGVQLTANPSSMFGSTDAFQLDVPRLMDRWSEVLARHGGTLRCGQTVTGLTRRTAPRSFVATVEGAEGVRRLAARCVVLAGGGIAADTHARRHLMGDDAEQLVVRNHRDARGDGLRLARALGGGLRGRPDGFYGHLIPFPLGDTDPTQPMIAQYHSQHGVLLDAAGRRLTPAGRHDHRNNQAVFSLPGSWAVLIVDEATRRGQAPDRVAAARQLGARTTTAPTLDALAERLAGWGLDTPATRESLAGASTSLASAPFHAVAVRPSITLADRGVRVNGSAAVVDAADQPVPDLFCAGADVGGMFGLGYAGGLAAALTLGRTAGRMAAQAVTASRGR